MSQRELAVHAGISQTQLARLETGDNDNPQLRTLERLASAACARVAIVDVDGTEPGCLTTDDRRDAAERRFPPHLDTRPVINWRRLARAPRFSFRRSRRARDELRRDDSGQRKWDMFTEFRLLGPHDHAALSVLRTDAAQFDLADRALPAPPPINDAQALRYLRDPAVRHFVAEDRGRILGHLVAHLQIRYDRPPSLLVTGLGLRVGHRDDLTGPHLAAALCEEADRLDVGDIWAWADHPTATFHLRHLGFRAAPRRVRLLVV
jgi:transcriptional regulator with XRE-family HTH domain